MAGTLTADDMTVYTVEITTAEGTQSRTVHAAYVASEPGWVLFKDHEHRVVAQFNDHLVIMVWRGDMIPGSDEGRIRDAMTEAHQHPGHTITR